MKINYELGYKPVTFSELTDDDEFWIGCNTKIIKVDVTPCQTGSAPTILKNKPHAEE